MKIVRFLVALALSCQVIGPGGNLAAQTASAQYAPTAAQKAAAEQFITEAYLRGNIRFLASDLLEGRGPGTRGDELSMSYITAQFEAMGLQPAAANGSWIQEVPLVGITSGAPKTMNFRSGEKSVSLQHYEEFIAGSGRPQEELTVADTEIVFVGYGIQAPEYQWDDFKDVDVRGKILLMMNNDPADDPKMFAGSKRLYYGRWDYKYAQAAKMGAAGAFIIHTTPSASYPFQVVQTSWTGEQMSLGDEAENDLPLKGWLTEDATRKLTALAGLDLDELRKQAESRDFRPVPLKTTTSVTVKTLVRNAKTGNVLALLPGSDPELSKEWVVFMAHHDHIGMTEARDASVDHIYNGAIDNASGVGCLLGIARAITNLPPAERPKRSILFAAVGAEEQGLLGSKFLSNNPPIPAGRLAAVINMDGMNILGRTKDVEVVGFGKSDLDQTVQRVARWQDRVVVGDQFPEKGYYYRSDQFSLAKIGVPAVYLGNGVHVIGKPDGWGKEQLRIWNDTIYHQPSDEYQDNWDFSGAIEDAHLMFYVGMITANQKELPRWVPGDEFEATRRAAIESLNK